MSVELHLGDCLDVFRDVRGLRAIVADPPAGIGFMGRSWDRPPKGTAHRRSLPVRSREHERRLQDRDAFVEYWAERLAVGYDACADDAVALIWALPRTHGWTSRALEDAGWRVVDSISHLFGQGWPKTPSVLKPAREDWIVGVKGRFDLDVDACRVPRNWDERGEAWLRSGHSAKPDVQKISGAPPGNGINANPRGARPANIVVSHAEGCVLRGTRWLRANVMGPHGVTTSIGYGGSDGLRPGEGQARTYGGADGTETVPAYDCLVGCDCGASWLAPAGGRAPRCADCGYLGWWACPVAEIDAQSGDAPSGARAAGVRKGLGYGGAEGDGGPAINSSSGGASRFFNRFVYVAKCPSGERHAGCAHLFWRVEKSRLFGFRRITGEEYATLVAREIAEGLRPGDLAAAGNVHPTVKRLKLMFLLHALVGSGAGPEVPPVRIGDLCFGSGTGAIAAHLAGIDWIGAEICPESVEISVARLAWWRGLSHEAVREFLATDTVPAPPHPPPSTDRQIGLFGGINA